MPKKITLSIITITTMILSIPLVFAVPPIDNLDFFKGIEEEDNTYNTSASPMDIYMPQDLGTLMCADAGSSGELSSGSSSSPPAFNRQQSINLDSIYQGDLSVCYACSATALLEQHLKSQNLLELNAHILPQTIIRHASKGVLGKGGHVYSALSEIRKVGIVTGTFSRQTASRDVLSDITAMKIKNPDDFVYLIFKRLESLQNYNLSRKTLIRECEANRGDLIDFGASGKLIDYAEEVTNKLINEELVEFGSQAQFYADMFKKDDLDLRKHDIDSFGVRLPDFNINYFKARDDNDIISLLLKAKASKTYVSILCQNRDKQNHTIVIKDVVRKCCNGADGKLYCKTFFDVQNSWGSKYNGYLAAGPIMKCMHKIGGEMIWLEKCERPSLSSQRHSSNKNICVQNNNIVTKKITAIIDEEKKQAKLKAQEDQKKKSAETIIFNKLIEKDNLLADDPQSLLQINMAIKQYEGRLQRLIKEREKIIRAASEFAGVDVSSEIKAKNTKIELMQKLLNEKLLEKANKEKLLMRVAVTQRELDDHLKQERIAREKEKIAIEQAIEQAKIAKEREKIAQINAIIAKERKKILAEKRKKEKMLDTQVAIVNNGLDKIVKISAYLKASTKVVQKNFTDKDSIQYFNKITALNGKGNITKNFFFQEVQSKKIKDLNKIDKFLLEGLIAEGFIKRPKGLIKGQ
ncbi:MAG: hypothetical protein HQK51_16635 [Oligoflexia bacterium]|nr:hypothetical protein [Oligoflexia bacterium]